MKETIIKKLDSAYAWLARVQVSGDNVDLVAMARQELREAFRLVKQLEKEDGANG